MSFAVPPAFITHLLDLLVDPSLAKTNVVLNDKYINDNLKSFIYKYENYNIRNIKLESINEVDCTVIISYEYIEKINEDRDDVNWSINKISIDFINYPEVLK